MLPESWPYALLFDQGLEIPSSAGMKQAVFAHPKREAVTAARRGIELYSPDLRTARRCDSRVFLPVSIDYADQVFRQPLLDGDNLG